MLSANYIRLQQNFLMEKTSKLTSQFSQANKRVQSPDIIWRHFTSIHNEILLFFEQLGAFNRFLSPHLSVYFAGHISIEVFLIYGSFFATQNLDWLMRYY